ncbi:septal ring lytic transglycosylase RlpA family protein [Photobacterium sp. DNB23_23_1]|uniref:Endolytic peptidoglycan transglycosylase RlpA n=1 Tax=Photobacterium pectinilyticum TaxID=2906793 RepID=A0ABT1N637_9GAMM|nr:septal ring lytic transglycosylase RlpA family protein [Photobacterium sp. ZSDE20]MCQ1060208.1 septal ring lytic transglycosylase RlpA family protein [Photobacterium sp. ZSDE20]MDD1827631.1 septal ring lytic transglycosylase RlpA family protein [Photobacterium sp. ZSDE20]
MKKIEYPNSMKKLNLLFTALILTLLAGCSSTVAIDEVKTRGYAKSHELIGQASWYGKKYHGRLTASGERYDMKAHTAAHRTLPFGTIVRVTNTANNKTVNVKINDRGPFAKGRVIDLSQKSFEQIGNINQGVAPVKIEIIDDSNTFRYKH